MVIGALGAVAMLMSAVAAAGVPCAGTSTVDANGSGACAPGAAVCPAGDYDRVIVDVVVRDCYGTPLAGQQVRVYPDPDAVHLCFCLGEVPQVGVTGPNGEMTVIFRHFGGCGNLHFEAETGGVILGPSNLIYIASYDNNGDCQVNLTDLIFFAGAYSTNDPCHDYDCSGIVGLTDFIFFAGHYLHMCPPFN
jgi:hypothetical protein